ncbi:MAG: sigma-70 family RNA polymerase sigma factor [Polyangiaceae bacterium]|nr:sigma-70 family RNA polymerase sigma factor [Polyangiaceae bacterium]
MTETAGFRHKKDVCAAPAAASARDEATDGPAVSPIPAELEERFERLYGEHFAFVWRTLRRWGLGHDCLDDAVQDVFVVALRRGKEFRGHSSYRTWLFGIASNVAREYRRKAQRATAFEPIADPHDARAPNPFDALTKAEAVGFLDEFLKTLDDSRRAVFVLAELEQMPAPEISEALGVKLNTVYSRLRSARQAFVSMMRGRLMEVP